MTPTQLEKAKEALATLREVVPLADRNAARFLHAELGNMFNRLARDYNFRKGLTRAEEEAAKSSRVR